MSDQELTVPTARQCLAEAYRELLMHDGETERAAQWLVMARELREDAQFRKMWVAPPPPVPAEAAPDRRTLHDVEGIVCAHGLVALHWKDDDQGGWWHHAGDGTACDNPDQSGDMFRRRSQEMREATGDQPVNLTMAGAEEPPTERLELRIEDDPATTLVRPFVEGTQWDRAAERHRLDVTAALPFPVPRQQPEEGQQAECRNHDTHNALVYEGGKWVHVSTGQTLCPIPGQTPEGDETYHRFANPA